MKATNLVIFFLLSIVIVAFIAWGSFSVGKMSSGSQNTNSNVSNFNTCSRTSPYNMDPELSRALDLYFQRISSHGENYSYWSTMDKKYKLLLNQRNCLSIKYVDTIDTLAYFRTDEYIPDEVNVYFSKTRKTENDIDNSILLAHELDHAAELMLSRDNNKPFLQCIDAETSAELAAYYYFTTQLNNGEFVAISNYPAGLSDIVDTVKNIGKLTLNTNIHKKYSCSLSNSDTNCFFNGIKSEIKTMLETSPEYSNVCSSS